MTLQNQNKNLLLKNALKNIVSPPSSMPLSSYSNQKKAGSSYIPNQTPTNTSMPAKKVYTDKMISNEADKIFTKNRPDLALKDKTFPLYGSMDASPNYNREYKRTLDQVRKTRQAMNQ